MKQLNIGTIKIPVTAATKSFAVLAKRGAGKTYTAAVIAEEFSKANVPFVIFDPIDVWWGLRLAANGKDKGLPVVVFGLEHADIQITRDMGAKIAQAIVKENISCVISTFGMPKVAQRHLIAEFSEELIKINNTPRHVFIEEAHEFVPQRVQAGMGKCFSAVEALVVMGRNRGIGVTLINQRAATLNKDVLTQVDTLLAFRNVAPQDRKALKEWVEAHSAEEDFDSFFKSLPSLPTGEGWIWSPEFMGVFEKIKIRKRETFHPDREKLGMNFKIPVIKQNDIAGFIESFSEKKKAPEVPKKEMIAQLQQKNVEIDSKAIQKAVNEALVKRDREWEKIVKNWVSYTKQLVKNIAEANKHLLSFHPSFPPEEPNNNIDVYKNTYKNIPGTVTVEKILSDKKALVTASYLNEGISNLGICEKKIYSFLATNMAKSFSKVQVSGVTGYSQSSGGFNNALSKLNSLGLIQRDNGMIKCAVFNPEYIISSEEYTHHIWLTKLPKCPKEIYQVLLTHYDSEFTKDQLAEMTNYQPTSGGFNNAISQLNSLGLITRLNGRIQLNQELRNI